MVQLSPPYASLLINCRRRLQLLLNMPASSLLNFPSRSSTRSFFTRKVCYLLRPTCNFALLPFFTVTRARQTEHKRQGAQDSLSRQITSPSLLLSHFALLIASAKSRSGCDSSLCPVDCSRTAVGCKLPLSLLLFRSSSYCLVYSFRVCSGDGIRHKHIHKQN